MQTIKRDIYVTKNVLQAPIEVTEGTNSIAIEFDVRDYEIPASAAAVAYSLSTSSMEEPNKALADVIGNKITIIPSETFFLPGQNVMQIRIIDGNSKLISFNIIVKCTGKMRFGDEKEAQQSTLVEQMLAKLGEYQKKSASPYNFKGSCLSSELPASGNTINDTYYCTDLKYRKTWNGSAWEQSSLNEADYEDELTKTNGEVSSLKEDLVNIVDAENDGILYTNFKKYNAYIDASGVTHDLNTTRLAIFRITKGNYYILDLSDCNFKRIAFSNSLYENGITLNSVQSVGNVYKFESEYDYLYAYYHNNANVGVEGNPTLSHKTIAYKNGEKINEITKDYSSFSNTIESGTVTIKDGDNSNPILFKLYGRCYQNGIPNGTNPLAVETVGISGRIKVIKEATYEYAIPSTLLGFRNARDYLYKDTKGWHIDRNMKLFTINGESNIEGVKAYTNTIRFQVSIPDGYLYSPNDEQSLLCNLLPRKTVNEIVLNDEVGVCCYSYMNNITYIMCRIPVSSVSTKDVQGIKTYLSNHSIYVYYPLRESTTLDINSDDLDNMYEDLVGNYTITTNYDNANLRPSFEITYKLDTDKIVKDIKLNENRNLCPILTSPNGSKYRVFVKDDGTISTGKYYPNRILFLGNSITQHGINANWWNVCGMAASRTENDYAHKVVSKLSDYDSDINAQYVSFATWESGDTASRQTFAETYLPAIFRDGIDVAVIVIGENVQNASESGKASFENDFKNLIKYMRSLSNNCQIIVCGNFMYSENRMDVEKAKEAVANDLRLPFVSIKEHYNDLGMSYIGAKVYDADNTLHYIYNSGVASHPCDVGMEKIANDILDAILI